MTAVGAVGGGKGRFGAIFRVGPQSVAKAAKLPGAKQRAPHRLPGLNRHSAKAPSRTMAASPPASLR